MVIQCWFSATWRVFHLHKMQDTSFSTLCMAFLQPVFPFLKAGKHCARSYLDMSLLLAQKWKKFQVVWTLAKYCIAQAVVIYIMTASWSCNSPVVRSTPSLVCWAVCVVWFWTERLTHPDLQLWGWCGHSPSLLLPAEQMSGERKKSEPSQSE